MKEHAASHCRASSFLEREGEPQRLLHPCGVWVGEQNNKQTGLTQEREGRQAPGNFPGNSRTHMSLLLLPIVNVVACTGQQLARSPLLVAKANARSVAARTADVEELDQLFQEEQAAADARKRRVEESAARLAAIGTARQKLWPLPPRLRAHALPVLTLDRTLSADALRQLLNHECCAVHVRGFVAEATCGEIASRLSDGGSFSGWDIHAREAGPSGMSETEVAKFGLVSDEALASPKHFYEYLAPSTANDLDARLPGTLNPFTALRDALDEIHPEGCRPRTIGRWRLPLGTFRRMTHSKGLLHADTSTLLSRAHGEFSANVYVRTPTGRGALSVYPAMQYTPKTNGAVSRPANPMLLADLQALALEQGKGFDPVAQARLHAALPLQRTIPLSDGDLVLINTGRFHRVEPYGTGSKGDPQALRLSGQCWLQYRRGKALRMWV